MKQSVDLSSILDMAMGAIKERVDYEMGHIVDNILDQTQRLRRSGSWCSLWNFSRTATGR